MKKYTLKKSSGFTLIEMMIVILLIGIIGGVLAYNFKGSLDKGKVFKSEQGAEQIKNILMMEIAEGASIDNLSTKWGDIVKASPIVAKPEDLMKDGWGFTYEVSHHNGEIEITSPGLKKYNAKNKKSGT